MGVAASEGRSTPADGRSSSPNPRRHARSGNWGRSAPRAARASVAARHDIVVTTTGYERVYRRAIDVDSAQAALAPSVVPGFTRVKAARR
jgi:hypothetical protein